MVWKTPGCGYSTTSRGWGVAFSLTEQRTTTSLDRRRVKTHWRLCVVPAFGHNKAAKYQQQAKKIPAPWSGCAKPVRAEKKHCSYPHAHGTMNVASLLFNRGWVSETTLSPGLVMHSSAKRLEPAQQPMQIPLVALLSLTSLARSAASAFLRAAAAIAALSSAV